MQKNFNLLISDPSGIMSIFVALDQNLDLIPDDPGLPGYVSETLLLSYA
jgi:hypothetical protein